MIISCHGKGLRVATEISMELPLLSTFDDGEVCVKRPAEAVDLESKISIVPLRCAFSFVLVFLLPTPPCTIYTLYCRFGHFFYVEQKDTTRHTHRSPACALCLSRCISIAHINSSEPSSSLRSWALACALRACARSSWRSCSVRLLALGWFFVL